MKILQINNFHYRKGGSEAVYFNTAELLKKNGHEVIFFPATMPRIYFARRVNILSPILTIFPVGKACRITFITERQKKN